MDSYTVRIKKTKHKRKPIQNIIIASNDVDDEARTLKYRPNLILIIAVILAVAVGVLLGIIYFEKKKDASYEQIIAENDSEILKLEEVNSDLNDQIDSLNEKVVILSNTVTAKTASEAELTEELQAQAVPTEFPLTGSADIEETEDENLNPMIIFTAGSGVTIVSSAAGTVSDITYDENYGNCVCIDHGNGYITYYYNKGEAIVRVGDEVSKGTAIFVVGEDNIELIYKMSLNGTFTDPLELLDING